MHAGGKLALRRSSAPVRRARPLRRPTAALPNRACLLGAAYFACPSFGSPSPGANGKGIPHLRGKGRGDQYVKFVVEVPRNLSEKQKELLREFDQLDSGNNKERGKFFDMLNRFKK